MTTLAMLALMAVQAVSSPTEQQSVAATSKVGQTLFDYDRAAWVGSNAMASAIPRDRLAGSGGWVMERAEDGSLRVTFYRGPADKAEAMFEAQVREHKVVTSRVLESGTMLAPTQVRLARVREAAMAEAGRQRWRPCTSATFNTVVLAPADPEAPAAAYLLSAQIETNAWPLGGHYRVMVGQDGRIITSRPFAKSCLAVKAPPKDARARLFVTTHLLDAMPTELHVFTSLASGMPLVVTTPDLRIWYVADGKVAGFMVEPKPVR